MSVPPRSLETDRHPPRRSRGSVGIDGDAEAAVGHDDLLAPNGAESKDGDDTLDATCNWWSDRSAPTHEDNPDGGGRWALERGSATVD